MESSEGQTRGSLGKRDNSKIKKSKIIEVKRVIKEWEIQDEEKETTKSEEEAKKLVPKHFHKQIKVFGKKASERILTKKIQDHVIELKKEFIPRKEKVYPLSREKREKVREFIQEQT